MLLGNLLKNTNKIYKKIFVNGISFDSRTVKKNNIFFAIDGNKNLGTKFINEAISKGASAIISNKKIRLNNYKVPLILVKNIRKSLTEVSSHFYREKPSNLIAVTGTNGKSSVADFFYQILNFHKISVASIGTLGINSKKYNKKTNLTSIDPVLLHKSLKVLKKNKVKNVILEASSHGLDQKRLDNLNLKMGIFTNLSHDHLDYHKSMKSYLNSKMHLFNNLLNKKSKIITDEDNKEFKIIKKISNKKKIKMLTIGRNSGTIRILENEYYDNKQIIKILFNKKIISLNIPLIGYFQIKNLLMAILAATSCGIKKNKIFEKVSKIKPVRGRLECIASLKNNSKIIVDFAHTPEALEQSLIAIKKQFNKKIIIVFGCGGDRDKKKRVKMGKIAKKYCDKIFVTDDNPRYENPKIIRNTIIKGCGKVYANIGNRKLAIKKAIKKLELESNQLLFVAGKGHENNQDYGRKIIKFSDIKIIKKLIKNKKFSNQKDSYQKKLIKKILRNKKIMDNKKVNYSGVSINTKTIKKNNLFFAIKGKKYDGHRFISQAIKKGAMQLIVSKKTKKIPSNKIIKVKNTFIALNDLAKVTRANTKAKIIGITGSVGKTTLKYLIAFGLNNFGKTYYSPHSYNNKYGVPLSISNLKKNTRYGVFEIGMDKKGEIDSLSKIIKPQIAVITNIAGAHFKNFKSLKDIAKAKAEIINNITPDGKIILNKDDKFFDFLFKKAIKKGIKIISFSMQKKADIYLIGIKKVKNFFILKVSINKIVYYFDVKHSTNNFVSNILACLSVFSILHLDIKKLKRKFINFNIPHGRGDTLIVKKFNKKFKFIDESYNANPLSMSSAINNMKHHQKKSNSRKLIFISDMLELGKKAKKFHRELSTVINNSDIDKAFVYGNHVKETFNSLSTNKKGKIFSNLDEAYNYFKFFLNNNDVLMVKGSNATGLSKFSKNIKKGKVNVI